MLRKLTQTEKEKVSRLWTISRKGKSQQIVDNQ